MGAVADGEKIKKAFAFYSILFILSKEQLAKGTADDRT